MAKSAFFPVRGLALAAAVMSSVDSSILSAASMGAWNLYRPLMNPGATAPDLRRVVRTGITLVGALAVLLALRERGPVPGERLTAVAFGAFRPGAAIGEDASWNRRVELVLQASDSAGAATALDLYEDRRTP